MPAQFHAKDLQDAFRQACDLEGSINDRLDLFVAAVRQHRPTSDQVAERLVTRLRKHKAGEGAPRVGDAMPPFVLPDETGRMVSLGELLGKGPAVVTFHRGHWCPFCRISINSLAKAQERVAALGASMVAIVPDRQQFAAGMKEESGARFPVLTDMDNGYAMSLNLAIWIGEEMQEHLVTIGRDLPQYHGNDSWMLPITATFVVGQDGRVRASLTDPDFRQRMTIEQLVDALK
jgi:peroxiredoxin